MTSNLPDDLTSLSVAELYELQEAAARELAEAKAQQVRVANAIGTKHGVVVQAAYDRVGKQHGTVRIPLVDGIEAVGSATKKVDWDQPKLRALASAMTWEQVNHFFTIKFGVPESVYGGLPPDDVRKAQFDAARTVTYGAPKIVLEKKAI